MIRPKIGSILTAQAGARNDEKDYFGFNINPILIFKGLINR